MINFPSLDVYKFIAEYNCAAGIPVKGFSAITLLGPATASLGDLVAGADLLGRLDGGDLLQDHRVGDGNRADLRASHLHGGASEGRQGDFRCAIFRSGEGGGSGEDDGEDQLVHCRLRLLFVWLSLTNRICSAF